MRRLHHVENATNPAHSAIPDPRLVAAREARIAYEEAVNSDGVTASTWRAIARQMLITASGMEAAGVLKGFVTCHLDRAVDAANRADFCDRMVQVAREYTRVIDLSSLASA